MNQATAMMPPIGSNRTATIASAWLRLDGQPMPGYRTLEYEAKGPLDERTALLLAPSNAMEPAPLQKAAVLAMPLRLSDGQVHWPVLIHGRFSQQTAEEPLTLIDAWTTCLDQTPAWVAWEEDAQGMSIRWPQHAALKAKAGKGNRSQTTRRINGQDVHVLSEKTELPWTLKQALALVSAIAELGLDLSAIPPAIGNWPIDADCSLNQPLRQILRQLLEPWGLMIRRDMIWLGQNVVEQRRINSRASNAVILLEPSMRPSDLQVKRSPIRSRLWIAQAPGWLVEGTFDLMPGWDRSLQGQPTSRYAKSDPAFSDYANVYRYWVLNEDGRFTAEPFGNEQAFDLTGFFALDHALEPTALAFQDGLTLDEARQRRKPLIEISLDAGTNWQPYAGQATLRNDRAAIYFQDATLASDQLSAAIAGTLRVRVTACLQCPDPVRIQRWQGNPFAAQSQQKTLQTQAFGFRRVHESSINHAAIEQADLQADQADDRRNMTRWLLDQMDQQAAMPDAEQTTIELTLTSLQPLWNIGDRLISQPLAGEMAELGDQAYAPWTIRRLSCQWSTSDSNRPQMNIQLIP